VGSLLLPLTEKKKRKGRGEKKGKGGCAPLYPSLREKKSRGGEKKPRRRRLVNYYDILEKRNIQENGKKKEMIDMFKLPRLAEKGKKEKRRGRPALSHLFRQVRRGGESSKGKGRKAVVFFPFLPRGREKKRIKKEGRKSTYDDHRLVGLNQRPTVRRKKEEREKKKKGVGKEKKGKHKLTTNFPSG